MQYSDQRRDQFLGDGAGVLGLQEGLHIGEAGGGDGDVVVVGGVAGGEASAGGVGQGVQHSVKTAHVLGQLVDAVDLQVDMWTCQHAGMWTCGHVDMRVCGYVDMWT